MKDDIYFVLRERNFVTDLSTQPPPSSRRSISPFKTNPPAASGEINGVAHSEALSPAAASTGASPAANEIIEDSASPPAFSPTSAGGGPSTPLASEPLNGQESTTAQNNKTTQSRSFRGNQWTSRKRNSGTNRSARATSATNRPKASSAAVGTGGGGGHGGHGHSHHAPLVIPARYEIHFDKQVVSDYLEKNRRKDWIRLRPDRLKWTPFLVTRGFGLTTEVGSTAIEGTTLNGEGGAIGGKKDVNEEGRDNGFERSPSVEDTGYGEEEVAEEEPHSSPDDEEMHAEEEDDDEVLDFLGGSSSSSDSDDGDGYSSSSSTRRRRLQRGSRPSRSNTRPSRSTRQAVQAGPPTSSRPVRSSRARSSSTSQQAMEPMNGGGGSRSPQRS